MKIIQKEKIKDLCRVKCFGYTVYTREVVHGKDRLIRYKFFSLSCSIRTESKLSKIIRILKKPSKLITYYRLRKKIKLLSHSYNNGVLFVSQELTYTGSPNSLLRMARVAKERYKIVVLALQDGPFKYEFEKLGISVLCIEKNFLDTKIVREFISGFNFAIANTIGTSDFVKIYKDRLPVIWFIREAHNLEQYHIGRQKVLKNFPFVCCVSEYAKEYIDKTFNVNALICKNAVEDTPIGSSAEGKIKFLFSGTILPRKGLDILLRSWEHISGRFTNVELLIVGRVISSYEKYFNEEIQPFVENNELSIKYIGEITDREEYLKLLASVDVVVVPSRDESCSLVALEAAMMSKAIVVSKNVGAQYLCLNNAGFIYETESNDQLTSILSMLINNGRDYISSLGVKVRKNYEVESNYDSYFQRFNDILNKSEEYARNCRLNLSKEHKRLSEGSFNFVTYQTLSTIIQQNINKFRKFDLIVGIPRSGMIPAYMIGFLLNKNVCSLNELSEGLFNKKFGYRNINEDFVKNILILDDSILSGRAMADAKEIIRNTNLEKHYKISYGAIFGTSQNYADVDICLQILNPPRIFQWNYLNHPNCKEWCYDIDGVLCEDPPEKVNDDGPLYLNYILNAPPLFIPKYQIGALVSARLTKYQAATVQWANANNIRFKHIELLNLPNKNERIRQKAHTRTKIEFYLKHKEFKLFIESNEKQAIEIAKATKKPVICVENNTYYHFIE